ncbi:MAG: RNA-binding protein [Candidatus Aquicultor secundus]|uniref:RNA-binding protein n=1 Tax=Candidatus Aquicultor secundus TaxID=1973895 RepID=A0A2M7T8K0_9ACTN|nr:RNA-binding S4 domain-containing protein [Solirubrobacter sp.]PIU27051.1 MAG: RNA-binding protein [Candidatus Aquicultor secundus]PIW22230.1 MAG: RNA-binding protein [Candidatus Aquicultor secundus]PIX52622.1 MAG: RNA-binding protein [Candidatus Aquicultor secundus]PIY38932.1 MAG: RNA-binding protein [Candidatus Aquicultor secundus]
MRPGTRLEQLLKHAGLVSTGGEAKIRIQEGEIKVNNQVERRRGYKLKEGDVVTVGNDTVKVTIKE